MFFKLEKENLVLEKKNSEKEFQITNILHVHVFIHQELYFNLNPDPLRNFFNITILF